VKIYAVAVFGVPSHEDDAIRAVYTSIHLVKTFYARGTTLCVGVSDGKEKKKKLTIELMRQTLDSHGSSSSGKCGEC
jgi:hypothetical protein